MKIINIVGARPNFMKIAPLMREMQAHPELEPVLLHTGQHYDANMSQIFFDELGIPRPEINLGVGSGSHAWQTAQIMLRFDPVLLEQRPDWVLVLGDVNSTVACSLVAAKRHIPVAHVEAGVRSFDRTMPEEINRIVTDALADLLFTPSRQANKNLRQEGIPAEKIYFTGNIMVDTLLQSAEIAAQRKTWARWNLPPQGYAVLTLHRPVNVDNPDVLTRLVDTLAQVADQLPLVWPLHPRVARRLSEFGLLPRLKAVPGLLAVEPLGYLDFLSLLTQAKMVLTDSGGIQTETSVLGVPCLTLRENTEWPVTLSEGTNTLVGTDSRRILHETQRILDGESKAGRVPERWDGQTARRIVNVLLEQIV
jgi:UDP-N-acetylglucosamine 2-epimerase (non-hydrolysing)